MNRLQLYRLLRRNDKLCFRRNPAFEQSVVARVMMVIGSGIMAVYLIFFGTMMAMPANESHQPALLITLLPIFLLIDFATRFGLQQTPAMLVKPYMLLPLPRNAVVETFLLTSLSSSYNWLWLTLFVPYALIIFAGGVSLFTVLGIMASGMLLVLANSQFYLIVRTLVGRSLLWWLLPLVVYGSLWALMLLGGDTDALGDALEVFTDSAAEWWFPLLCMALLAVLFFTNRAMQRRYAFEELAREEKKAAAMRHVWQFAFLEHFGQMGEYLKLELKSIFRNKAMRSRVIMSLALVAIFSVLITFTDVYDGRMMLNFWCLYCFSIYGITTLVKVMGPEGNYIDMLMTHRENILSLLRAKYYFYCAILVVPLVIMLPAVVAGKFSAIMMLGYMLLTSGFIYGVLFQLAVYNKQTLPLNQKITGKGNVENGMQLFIEMVAMLAPVALVAVLILLFDEQTAYWVLTAIGLAATLAHPLWLRNIYQRMMARKYENLEGFHATRG